MSTNTTLFRTVHGSHLYGMAHAASDADFYEVVQRERGARKHYAHQSIVDGVDTMAVDLSGFMAMADSGVPQALESMFSSQPIGVDHIAAYRYSYRVDLGAMLTTYRRTISNFVTGAVQNGDRKNTSEPEQSHADFKRRRHALRLALNYDQATHLGRFNPTLAPEQVEFITAAAHDTDSFLDTVIEMFPYLTVTELLSRGYKSGAHMMPTAFLRHLQRHDLTAEHDGASPRGSADRVIMVPTPDGHRLAEGQRLPDAFETAVFFLPQANER